MSDLTHFDMQPILMDPNVEVKKIGNAKAWWRRGKCLLEMGRLDEAASWVRGGLEVEGEEGELVALLKEIEAKREAH
uniref:Uncharacterized protein n=1 Tax=Bionectria ochroleuca TaxID=29856 RepID=A0A0B7K4Q9_BIOOC